MAPKRRVDPNETMVICPYNEKHIIYSGRLLRHIIKCQEKYPPLAICPYNALHRMPHADLEKHIQSCPSVINRSQTFTDGVHGLIERVDYSAENRDPDDPCWD